MRITLLTLLTLFCVQLHAQTAQDNMITVDGEIINAKDNSPVPFVHIVNTSTQQGTASNSQGRFEITMGAQDTLMFSAIGYEPYTFQLSDDINTKRIIVTIVLDEDAMELEPVQIFAYKDERALKRAIVEIELPEEQSNRMQLKGLGYYYGPRKEAKAGASSPISFIASRISRKERENMRK